MKLTINNQDTKQVTKSLPRTIHAGQFFAGSSLGEKNQIWVVTRRVKTETQNFVWTKCFATGQTKKYTGSSFGYLIRTGIIRLLKLQPKASVDQSRVVEDWGGEYCLAK